MAAQPHIWISPEEYLQMEHSAPFKSEYFNGQVYAMSGASINHNRIVRDLTVSLGLYLKGKSCEVFPSDLRIKVPAWPSYFYPDLSIVCGEPELVDKDNVVNPSVIVEVGSISTEEHDRVFKFGVYREIRSLREYILISSLRMQVTVFRKVGNDHPIWIENVYNQATDCLHIETIDLKLPLSEIYENVDFAGIIPIH